MSCQGQGYVWEVICVLCGTDVRSDWSSARSAHCKSPCFAGTGLFPALVPKLSLDGDLSLPGPYRKHNMCDTQLHPDKVMYSTSYCDSTFS